jgi:hypothetical protein
MTYYRTIGQESRNILHKDMPERSAIMVLIFWNSSGVTNPARIQLFKIETVV